MDDLLRLLQIGFWAYIVFAAIVLVLVVTTFVFVMRQMVKMDRRHDEMRERMFPGQRRR